MTSDRQALRVSLIAEQLLQPVPGGIGTYVRALMDYLPRTGVQVEPVTAWHRPNELADSGVSHAVRLKRPRRWLYASWARSGKPRVKGRLVHAPSLAFPSRGDGPLVVTAHDVLFRDFPDAYPKRGVEFHERMLAKLWQADAVIAPSEATADALRTLRDGPKNIHIVPMGTDLRVPSDADALLERLGVERPYVLWMGTMEPRKNPEGVVKGFVNAVTSLKDEATNLYLVGPPGWWKGDVATLLEDRDLASRVRRIEWQPANVKAALYSRARAFVFPSLAEGFGLPVIEAMACGAPVVTSDRSSLPEVAGSAALLCDPDDATSIGSQLAKVLRDDDLADDLRRLGRERAAVFTWEHTARETLSVYREVLG